MLILNNASQRFDMPGATGVWFELRPLPTDKDAEFVRETTTVSFDESGTRPVDYKRDVAKYSALIGEYCIRAWGGIGDKDGNPIPLTNESARQAMMLSPIEKFVISKVKGLSVLVRNEVDAGKND